MPLRDDVVAVELRDVLALEPDLPLRGLIRPEMLRSVVDFPAPLLPISVTISPGCTSKEMPLTAAMLP